MSEVTTALSIVAVIIAIVVAIVTSTFAAKWQWAKSKITAIRVLFDRLDEALKDDKVTEDEWNGIYEALKALIKRK